MKHVALAIASQFSIIRTRGSREQRKPFLLLLGERAGVRADFKPKLNCIISTACHTEETLQFFMSSQLRERRGLKGMAQTSATLPDKPDR